MGDYFADLEKTVLGVIDEERLGQPQFVRCVAGTDYEGDLLPILEQIISITKIWFRGDPFKQIRRGESSGIYLTEMAIWDTGESSLITVMQDNKGLGTTMDLMFVGSRGTLYHKV
tara:strand:+ start:562 stop:906 length:345 start_codon:yes stop_codon:yes gene_type:complete